MQRSSYKIDMRRTKELNLPELLVLAGEGDDAHYYCIPNPDMLHPVCPACGYSVVRNQGNLNRDFLDGFKRNREGVFVTLSVRFRKYRCMSHNCGRIFYPEFTFASPYARTTHRLEDAIVRSILEMGYSYSQVAWELYGKLSRQAVGQIFHRRVKELDEDTSPGAKWYRQLYQDPYGLMAYSSRLASLDM